MAELLLELLGEEIPARMQKRAAEALEKAVLDGLSLAGIKPEGAASFVTPRRLILTIKGLPSEQPDRREERKGPRVGAPEKAIAGFLNSVGLVSVDDCETRSDKKGEYYVVVIDEKGRPTSEIIAELIEKVIRDFSWPKSMRWGDGDLKWVRPLHSILCAFDGEVVPFEIDGITSGDATSGHRFHAPAEILVRNFEEYAVEIARARVMIDREQRMDVIAQEAKTLCEAQNFEWIEDSGLLEEVAGLVEWPVVKIGEIDPKFLDLPAEVLSTSMKTHQKYFSVRDPKTGGLAPRFVYVANIEPRDGGAGMTRGYERVLTARLSDGYFLYGEDLKTPLADRVKALDEITFFEGLGSLGDKSRRVQALAMGLSEAVGADYALVHEAAELAKADLTTGMVAEFPELQGITGRYYHLMQNLSVDRPILYALSAPEDKAVQVADAIRDHYKPAGQDDAAPSAPVSVAVALADKLDTLLAFWAVDKKPTGSKDPFALRRAALGVIRIILENEVRLQLGGASMREALARVPGGPKDASDGEACLADLIGFFHDRLKVHLREKGARYDLIDAVLRDENNHLHDDIVLIVARLRALESFAASDDGANLLAAYKRAANILRAEEKKDDRSHSGEPEPSLYSQDEEKALGEALATSATEAEARQRAQDFRGAMERLAELRGPLDNFFDVVTVNHHDTSLRLNRLKLLSQVRSACDAIADFSKLEG